MKREKRFFENEKLVMYLGIIVFVALAVAIGIIMYMITNATPKIRENIGDTVADEQVNKKETESVTNIFKVLSEQSHETRQPFSYEDGDTMFIRDYRPAGKLSQ